MTAPADEKGEDRAWALGVARAFLAPRDGEQALPGATAGGGLSPGNAVVVAVMPLVTAVDVTTAGEQAGENAQEEGDG